MSWVLGCPEGHVESILNRKLTEEEQKKNDEILFDSAGFVPLDVRIKQMERAGIRAQSQQYSADINLLRESYNVAEFEPEEGDSVEDIVAKEIARQNYYFSKLNEKHSDEEKNYPHEAGGNKEAEKPIVGNSDDKSDVSE